MLMPLGRIIAQPVLLSCVRQADPIACSRHELQEAFQSALDDITVEGTLVFRLTIDTLGRLKTVDLLRDLDPPLGERAVSVFDQIPDWTPLVEQGQVQEATFVLPVTLGSGHHLSGYRISWGRDRGEGITRADLDQLAMEPVLVLDTEGRTVPPSEVVITWQRRGKTKTWRSPSRLNAQARKGLNRCRAGGTLTLVAYAQQGTRFQEVIRTWAILP